MTPGARTRIGTWLDRLQEWNARIDLTAARSDEELVDLMLADALVLSARIPAGARLVDVGTGAGAPGLALAILRDDLCVTLVEPVGKRVSFLRTVLGAVGRADVVVERRRGEVLAGSRSWDIATSRATLAPATWLELGTKLVAPGGRVWVLLASGAPPNQRAHDDRGRKGHLRLAAHAAPSDARRVVPSKRVGRRFLGPGRAPMRALVR